MAGVSRDGRSNWGRAARVAETVQGSHITLLHERDAPPNGRFLNRAVQSTEESDRDLGNKFENWGRCSAQHRMPNMVCVFECDTQKPLAGMVIEAAIRQNEHGIAYSPVAKIASSSAAMMWG